MKIFLKIIFLISILLIINFSNAQTIVNMAGNSTNLPSNYRSTGNYYIKDVNNYLDNFTGTWEYVNGNEKFQIILTKVYKYHTIGLILI